MNIFEDIIEFYKNCDKLYIYAGVALVIIAIFELLFNSKKLFLIINLLLFTFVFLGIFVREEYDLIFIFILISVVIKLPNYQ